MSTIACDAWCGHDFYYWHCFAGRPGTNNNINLLAPLPLLRDILDGLYTIKHRNGYRIVRDGTEWNLYYFLVDGIYPNRQLFVKPMHQATTSVKPNYSELQESVRKDV